MQMAMPNSGNCLTSPVMIGPMMLTGSPLATKATSVSLTRTILLSIGTSEVGRCWVQFKWKTKTFVIVNVDDTDCSGFYNQ